MKQVLVQYANYNQWANKRIIDVVTNLSDEQLHRDHNTSFRSIFGLVKHLWDVEFIWWQRVKLMENIQWPSETFEGSVIELGNNLQQQSKQWAEWVDLATEAALSHEFIYRNSKKEQFKQPVFEVLMHLFNHQTYHRGQIISMLRQENVKDIPATDLIAFLRKK